MVAFLICLLCVVFGLALMSAIGIIVVHKLFAPNLPPGIQELHALFMQILSGSAKLILGPFELLKRINISFRQPPPLPPGDDTKLITKE
jgi:hypothetical protein